MLKALPGQSFPMRPLTDADVGKIQEWMQRHAIKRIGRDTAHQACDMMARENTFHPIRDYLEGLEWDGEPRLDRWLVDYLGVGPISPYVSMVGPMFMIGMVARVIQPGCKLDYMLVLEGPQGTKKSSACAILAGEWFSDNLPDVTIGKDVSQHLRGKWLIEISEMSALSRAENAALKAFLTRQVERYRPSYGRHEVIQPRQCVFVGSTNKSAYLRDETGGRRFWPIKTGKIDLYGLERDRDQLFAEAMHNFLAGSPWWPTADEEAEHFKSHQDARYEADAWEEPVVEFVARHKKVSVFEVARHALNIDTPRIGTADQRRIAAILERLGWERRPSKNSKGRIEWEPRI
jgi:predicted P-loop ATPase